MLKKENYDTRTKVSYDGSSASEDGNECALVEGGVHGRFGSRPEFRRALLVLRRKKGVLFLPNSAQISPSEI